MIKEYKTYLLSLINSKSLVFENKLEIGLGLYTTSEVAQILQLPYYKVHKWINDYWDGELGREFERKYSWNS